MAGAAFLGALSGAEVPREAGMPHVQSAEAREGFNADQEAKAFLDYVGSMEVRIDDPRGRHTLRTKVEIAFEQFTLAFAKRIPHYSVGSESAITGTIDPNAQDAAKAFLLPKLSQRLNRSDPGIQSLYEIVAGKRSDGGTQVPPRPSLDPQLGGMKHQPSEIRRSRQSDW